MKRAPVVFGLTMLVAAPLQAQTNITQYASFTDQQTVLYLPFAVYGAGAFDFETSFGVPLVIDPHIRLYANACTDGACLGAGLGSDNNAGSGVNSSLSADLGVGEYTLALSVWDFTDAEARAGNAGFDDVVLTRWGAVQPTNCDDSDHLPCFYRASITSADGVASPTRAVGVPEPMSAMLLGTGMLGLVGVARRRREELVD